MVDKKRSTREVRPRTTFMFPGLHHSIVKAVSHTVGSVYYCSSKDRKTLEHEYSTHIMGSFKSLNKRCSSNGWTSKKVTIVIKGFAGGGYNAVVYNQRCKSCNGLGKFTMDKQSYVDRVAYRVQKWAGVRMESGHVASSYGSIPHKSEFCEGCKRGVCQESDGWL